MSYNEAVAQKEKRQRFDYEEMKAAATHKDRAIRKAMFKEYFARFQEFPSYLFDNEQRIDTMLLETLEDLERDAELTKELRAGIDALLERLPARTV